MEQNTDQLVTNARSGDTEAFAELMTRHCGLVRRTAFAILKNPDDADDVAQDVSLKVFRKLHTFQSQAAFSTWLTRIVINTSLMHLRKLRRSKLSSLDELMEGEDARSHEVSDPRPGPDQQYLSEETRALLYGGIKRLPPVFRSVLMDKVYAELPMEEIAERSGVSVAAAKSRSMRARVMLADRLRGSNSALMRIPMHHRGKFVSNLEA